MKTKNMRKKALVSSVAMLLVAVVALGGATYAWFTANSSATVKGFSMRAAKTSSLLFSTSADGDFKPGLDFKTKLDPTDAEKTPAGGGWSDGLYAIRPVSCADKTSASVGSVAGQPTITGFFKVDPTADPASNPSDLGTTLVGSISSASENTDFIKKTIFAKTETENASLYVSGLTVTSGSTNFTSSLLRVAVKAVATQSTPERTVVYSPGEVTGAKNGIKAGNDSLSESGVTFNHLYNNWNDPEDTTHNGKAVVSSLVGTQTVSDKTSSNIICALPAGTAVELEIYVWLEGNQSGCGDSEAGKEMPGLDITFAVVRSNG